MALGHIGSLMCVKCLAMPQPIKFIKNSQNLEIQSKFDSGWISLKTTGILQGRSGRSNFAVHSLGVFILDAWTAKLNETSPGLNWLFNVSQVFSHSINLAHVIKPQNLLVVTKINYHKSRQHEQCP